MSAEKAYSSILNSVLHRIADPGRLTPWDAARIFSGDHFEGHSRVVVDVTGDYGPAIGDVGYRGVVELAEDDDYRQSRYRMTFNADRFIWEFRAPLD